MAGGTGTRMGAGMPKQFLLLRGAPVLLHTLRRFAEPALAVAEIIVVLPADQLATWQALCAEHWRGYSAPAGGGGPHAAGPR
ncbi:IspD/TarI family cytidylyltransferase [Hymenobacter coccineus]|uniref:2-C-methyl-D-erythritol 4-phosphate cytidylyltransferase n=1 Tax=Hymenobacter coccineus TaxID=1908235 RepID=A0A1G1THT5_9BACT|nr:2-C-methyl-D-erythritol 4-phosphate cytidylyltransferase [Hymenobacter coccineus]OGX90425.1 hypothetical protein BEN49_22825 [Hymenobacter coccineus]